MKLITDSRLLTKEFKRLLHSYNKYSWATAWAGNHPLLLEMLKNNEEKIEKLVIGTHFYQTHPNFIATFINNPRVKYIKQPKGTFHPKVYLFCNNTIDWELLVGSANFTTQAFTDNIEATVLISPDDLEAKDSYHTALNLIKESFQEAQEFSKDELKRYIAVWENQKSKLASLSGNYGSPRKSTPKLIADVEVMNWSWKEYLEKVKRETSEHIEKRTKVIGIAASLFSQYSHFRDIPEEKRKFIAGLPTPYNSEEDPLWAYFGSMKGAGLYANKIIENDLYISRALDEIPLIGQITKKHYDNFIRYYSKALGGNYIATATRLLSMKRPDVFICFDSKNRKEMCADFDTPYSTMTYENYWENIILRIMDSDWWLNPAPGSKNKIEQKISNARAAFLDSIYYEGFE
jgi:hypothetical protein